MSVKYLLPAEEIDMGGIKVKQALPTDKVQQVDPYLLLHHMQHITTNLQAAKQQGVGPHPHRGFSPVTFIINGQLHHQDSRGNSQIANKGDVQWVNAGAGIVHSERPTEETTSQNGLLEVIQLWINTPAAKKMNPPVYQYVVNEDCPRFFSEDKLVENKLITGKYRSLEGQMKAQSELLIIWGASKKGGKLNLELIKKHSVSIYVINGQMSIDGFGLVEAEQLVVLDTPLDFVQLKFNSDTQFLFLSGLPIDEKVSQYGPFVMNTQTEIMEAIRDFQMGKMGVLVEV